MLSGVEFGAALVVTSGNERRPDAINLTAHETHRLYLLGFGCLALTVAGFFSGLPAFIFSWGFGGVFTSRPMIRLVSFRELSFAMSKDDPEWVLHIPEVGEEFAQRVGEFAIYWGVVEDRLDALFPILFTIDPTLAVCVTANLGTKPKVEMLQSATSMLAPALPADAVKDLHETLELVLELSAKYRNFLAHGRPIVTAEEDGESYWLWGRYAARKQVAMFAPDNDADYWRIATGTLQVVIDGLFDAAREMHPILSALTPAQISAVCEIRETKT